MKVLLISANTEQINMPTLPLGLACVAAATRKAGHEVAYLDLMAQEDVRTVIKEAMEGLSPDVVGISVRNIDDQVMDSPGFLLEQVKEVVASCRSFSDSPIVLGGAGYSMYPESALEYLGADMGIQGEGEVAFPA
ncbi:MAG: cobalamin-dependent protein, partial [Deltaproteobacteria bacterium]|nr:cobalamin-dependent protein [Deltaproteobacteria bacterium]